MSNTRRFWFFPATFVAITVFACSVSTEKRDGKASLPEEEAVRAWILEHADDPASVEFAKWGPHDLTGEIAELQWKITRAYGAQAPAEMIAETDQNRGQQAVRVVWRERNKKGALERFDHLFYLRGGKVQGHRESDGDTWLEQERQLYQKTLERVSNR